MKNLFITGALGQDGTILTNILKKNKQLNVYQLVEKNKPIKSKKNLIKVNLLKLKEIQNIFSKIKPDYVLHMGSSNPSFKEKDYNKYYLKNMISTENIFYTTFNYNIKSKFLFCNSSQIFKNKFGKVNENSKYKIKTDYTRFRIMCNKKMQKYKVKKNLKYSNIILFNHDSIYRNPKFLIPRIVKSLLKKKTNFLNLILEENINADFSHAEEICNGLIKILFSKHNENNVILSSGKLTSVSEIINYIIKKRKIKINLNKSKILSQKGLIGDNSLAKKKFNWKIKKSILDASLEIYDFYKKKK